MSRDVPLLTADLVRRLERLIAPEITTGSLGLEPGAPTIAQFGATIATKARGGPPSNKVFCFSDADLGRLGDILAFYAVDALEPTFYLTPVSFSRRVCAELASLGFAQHEFQQAVLYGLPSTELTSPPPVRAGTTYVDRTRMGRFVGEVTEHVPATRIAFSETLSWFGRPLTQARPSYVLEADGDSTVVRHVAEAELYGPMRFLKPAAAWMATRERTHTLTSLKRSIEGE